MPMVQPGDKVTVTQVVHDRHGERAHTIRGTVVSVGVRPTGSWFAHGKNDRLWLQRVELRKDDGELTLVNVDASTVISPAT